MKIGFAVFAASMLAQCAFAGASTHYAVCVGVNEYDPENIPEDSWLVGCVPDACNIWTNITGRGEWTEKTAITLLDSGATTAAIRSAITNAAAVAEAGDVFLYMHSSHGGARTKNHEYTTDVYLCTYDDDYRDSELAADLAQFKSGVKVVVLVDACHSGGLFKAKGAKVVAGAEDGLGEGGPVLRSLGEGGFDLAGRVTAHLDAIRARESRVRGLKRKGIDSSEIGWVTAADYNQFSWDGWDYNHGYGGAFIRAILDGWEYGYCDDAGCGNEDNYADFYELWNYAKDIAVGNGEPGTANYTQAQCANPKVLLSVAAGWVGDSPPPEPDSPPRFREIGDIDTVLGETESFYVRAYSPAGVPATVALVEGDESATFTDGVFSFTPVACGKYRFVLSAENANGSVTEEFTITARLARPEIPTIEDVTDTSFKVCWTTVQGADDYLVDVEYTDYEYAFLEKVGNVTEYVVEGLSPDTTYYVWIRAYDGETASDWSYRTSVQTDKPHVAPGWPAIPVQAAQAGRLSMLDLSQFVTGWPAPSFEVVAGEATLDGSVLKFTPPATGAFAVTVRAGNYLGQAETTISFEAGELVPKKFALCVGINEYEDLEGLSGCVNDAKFMAANLVERGGWDPADVTLLTDEDATKSAIRGAISNIAEMSVAGDTFVYQHSSHGGQLNAGYDDDEPLSGEEGLATFLCVYDEYYDDNTTAYNDYEIAADLAAFPAGVKTAVIVDACHSGGLFKSEERGKGPIDLAGRVSRLIESGRARSKARGEDVSRSLSADEIGWATATEYNAYSYDGGFYNSDKWMQDPMYGEEYWTFSGYFGYYDYPDSYRLGGVFLASATWGWWNGDADTDKDGRCNAYEFWQAGYNFCSELGEFWYGDSDRNFYPQCTNESVLASIELGRTAPAEPFPALAADAAPELIASALAGSADSAVVEHVADMDMYSAYRDWAQSVTAPGGGTSAGLDEVRASPQAWISFALGSAALLDSALEEEDIQIVKFEPAEGEGAYAIEFAIDGVAIGSSDAVSEELLLANLRKVVSVESGTSPDPDTFDGDFADFDISLEAGGKAKIEVAPPAAAKESFFFRFNVLPGGS